MVDFQPYDATSHPIVKLIEDWNNLLDHGLEKQATYIVRINGSYYEAIKGGTSTGAGTIAYGGEDNAGAVDGTNAAAVIQAALDAVESAGGGSLYLSAGDYDIRNKCTVGSRTMIQGVGDATRLHQNDNLDYIFETKVDQINWRNVFANFSVDGKKASRTSGTAIHLQSAQHAEVYGISIEDMKEHGIVLSGTLTNQTLGCFLHHNYMRDCESHFVESGDEAYDLLAQANIIGGTDRPIGNAFELVWDTHAKVQNNHIWQVNIGVHLFFCHHANIVDNIIDTPDMLGIHVQNSTDVIVAKNKVKNACQSSGTDGILFEGTIVSATQYYSDDCLAIGNRVFSDSGLRGITFGNYARRGFISGNDCYGNQDTLWDIWITGTGTDDTTYGINFGRCPASPYNNIHLDTSFVIGVGGVTAGDLVSISAANTVIKATLATAAKGIGVVIETGAQGTTAKILKFGRITVTADGAVNAGDLITASDGVPGRAKPTTVGGEVDTSQAGSHNHGGATGGGGSHYHTTDSSDPHSHTMSGESSHTHGIGYNAVWKDTNETEGHVHSYEDKEPQSPSQAGSIHYHTIYGGGEHWHTTGAGYPNEHNHTIANFSNHKHTVTIPSAIVFGKAATSAAGAGNTFDLIIGGIT